MTGVSYELARRRLGERLTDAERKLRVLQRELDHMLPTSAGFQETRWMLDREREAARLIRLEIDRLENRRNNAVNRTVIDLLRAENPSLCAQLLQRAEKQITPEYGQ